MESVNEELNFGGRNMSHIVGLAIGLLMYGMVGIANATLIPDGMIVHDTINGLTWLKNRNLFNELLYDEQISGIASLSTAGLTDWRMASHSDISNLWEYTAEQIIEAFTPNYEENNPYYGAWEGRVDHMSSSNHHYNVILEWWDNAAHKHPIHDYYIGDNGRTPSVSAWVVSPTVISSPVPEPATMLLFSTGLVGLAGISFRRRKK